MAAPPSSTTSNSNESLARLQTDVIDLVQFHEVIRMEDPDRIFAPGGAIEAAIAARQAGKLRYIGFTGHKDPAVHLRMLETAQKHSFHFDTVQMPINVMDAHFRSFTHQVMPVALKQGIGVLAMKTFGDSFILKSNTVQPMEALHYGLTQPISVLITGINNTQLLDQALEAARTFKPMTSRRGQSPARPHSSGRRRRQLRALQDHLALRRHRTQSEVVRIESKQHQSST